MKKVIIFTYYWPPGASPGVQRFLKFSKYLLENDWQPIIITVANGSYPSTDDSLLKEVPNKVRVYKTKTLEIFGLYNFIRGKKGKSLPVGMADIKESKSIFKKIAAYIRANFFIPDARSGWKKYAVKKAAEIIHNEDIATIITTGPPHSSHLIGAELRQRFKIKWVADFRDPWVNIYYNDFLPRTSATIKKDQELENLVLNNADVITVVSNGLLNEFKERAKRIELVYNGYDEKGFDNLEEEYKTETFDISYIGNFKHNQNIAAFWQAVSNLMKDSADFKKHARLKFVGNVHESVHQSLHEFDLIDNVIITNYLPHQEALQNTLYSNLLLFIIPQVPGNKVILTGKLFEYLAAKVPILPIGPIQGDAAKIITEIHKETMIDYDDSKAMENLIKSNFDQWVSSNQKAMRYSGNAHVKFSKKKQAQKLCEVLQSL